MNLGGNKRRCRCRGPVTVQDDGALARRSKRCNEIQSRILCCRKNLALSLANVVAGDVEYTGDNASTANLLQQIQKKR